MNSETVIEAPSATLGEVLTVLLVVAAIYAASGAMMTMSSDPSIGWAGLGITLGLGAIACAIITVNRK